MTEKKVGWLLRRDLEGCKDEDEDINDNSVERFASDHMTNVINYINSLRVRDKRVIFQIFRQNQIDANMFLPLYGVTVGEFAVGQVLDPKK